MPSSRIIANEGPLKIAGNIGCAVGKCNWNVPSSCYQALHYARLGRQAMQTAPHCVGIVLFFGGYVSLCFLEAGR